MMRQGCAVVLALAIGAAAPASEAAEPKRPQLADVVKQSVDTHIIPSYAALRDDTEKLKSDVEAWCAAEGGDGEAHAAVDRSFRKVVTSWAAVAFIRFGPARKDSRGQRLAFFPDPRGVAARQLRAALSRKDPKLIEPETFAQQSAAIQGLPALELLLTQDGTQSTKLDAYACALAVRISANVATLSRELAEEWTGENGWRATMVKPSPENAVYKSHEESAAELVRTLLTGLQIVRDQGFDAVLQGMEKGRPPSGLPFKHSRLATDYLAASIRSCAALTTALRLGDFVKDDPKVGWMSGWIGNALRSMESDAKALPLDAEPIVVGTQSKNLSNVRRGRFYANGLRQIIGRQIAPTAGLTLGFNELDGD